jgi:hypothetical protein
MKAEGYFHHADDASRENSLTLHNEIGITRDPSTRAPFASRLSPSLR